MRRSIIIIIITIIIIRGWFLTGRQRRLGPLWHRGTWELWPRSRGKTISKTRKVLFPLFEMTWPASSLITVWLGSSYFRETLSITSRKFELVITREFWNDLRRSLGVKHRINYIITQEAGQTHPFPFFIRKTWLRVKQIRNRGWQFLHLEKSSAPFRSKEWKGTLTVPTQRFLKCHKHIKSCYKRLNTIIPQLKY